jgi:hypothetical protein
MLARRTAPALLSLLLFAVPAAAQVADADRATARALAQQGQDALDGKDYATAAERFGRADAIVHAPTLMLGQARAEVGLGRWIAAMEHYARVVREGVPAGAPPAFGKALAEAQRELLALEPRVPAVVLQLKGAAGARVTVDGAPVPAAAMGVNRPVDPGKHVIRAEADGYAPVEVTVTLAEAKVETVALQIDVPRLAAPSPPPPAPHADAEPRSGGSPMRTAGFAILGVGGAGLLVGAVTGGLALSKHGQLAKLCPDGHCIDQQSAIDSYKLTGALSTAGFIGGGALALTGVVLLVAAPRGEAAPKQAWIAPIIGPGFAGAQGRF